MENKIVKADPKYRKRIIRMVFLVLIAGFILLRFAIRIFDYYLTAQNPETSLMIVSYTLATLFIIPAILSIVMLRIGSKTIKQRCFPPEGLKVFKDTPQLLDEDAIKRGKIMVGFAISIMLLCMAGTYLAITCVRTLA
jgi:hypothetical protein